MSERQLTPTPVSPRTLSLSRRQLLLAFAGAVGATAFSRYAPAALAEEADDLLLVGPDATWTYFDSEGGPSVADGALSWTRGDYDAAGWKTAVGPFGAKKGAATGITGGFTVNTLLTQYKTGTTTDIETYFFRTTFTLSAADFERVKSLSVSFAHDDGAIVYLNGQEAGRYDTAEVDTSVLMQYAGANDGDPITVSGAALDSGLLVEGENVLAVAIYQGRSSSSDIYFSLSALQAGTTLDAGITDVNLNIGADPSQRNFAWYTAHDVDGAVQVALASAATGTEFPAASAITVAATGGTATDGQRYQHATITGLVENSSYIYRVGSDENGWSATYAFVTNAFSGDYEYLFIGDAQIGAGSDDTADAQGWATTLATATAAYPDAHFILSAGDQVDSAANESQYAGFLAPGALTAYPLITNVGNHDYRSLAYRQHFNMPNIDESTVSAGESSSGYSGGSYWFVYNETLYISFNSNNTDNDGHIAYVRRIIAEQGAAARWIVVHFHHSVFSVANHATDSDIIERRRVLPPAFTELGVDVVLMGHDHCYTRSYLMDGVTSGLSVATGGVAPKPGEVLYVTANSSSGSKYYEIQSGRLNEFTWADEVNQEHTPNYSRITVTDTTFTVTTLRSADNTIVDEVTLFKARVNLSASTIERGQTLTIAVAGLTPATEFAVTAHSQAVSLGAVTADDSGAATLTWAVPADFELGDHTITVDALSAGADGSAVTLAAVAFTVSEATAAADEDTNDATGTDAADNAAGAAAASGAGAPAGLTGLAQTGAELTALLGAGAGLAAGGAGAVAAARHRAKAGAADGAEPAESDSALQA